MDSWATKAGIGSAEMVIDQKGMVAAVLEAEAEASSGCLVMAIVLAFAVVEGKLVIDFDTERVVAVEMDRKKKYTGAGIVAAVGLGTKRVCILRVHDLGIK